MRYSILVINKPYQLGKSVDWAMPHARRRYLLSNEALRIFDWKVTWLVYLFKVT